MSLMQVVQAIAELQYRQPTSTCSQILQEELLKAYELFKQLEQEIDELHVTHPSISYEQVAQLLFEAFKVSEVLAQVRQVE